MFVPAKKKCRKEIAKEKTTRSLEKRIDEKKKKKTKSLTAPPFLACCDSVFILVHTARPFDLRSPPLPSPAFRITCGSAEGRSGASGPQLTCATCQPTLLLNSRA